MIPYSIKAVVKDRVKKNGTYPIRIRIIINCVKSEHSLNIEIKNLTDFDENKQLVKNSTFNSDNYNKIIKKALQKAQQYFWDCDLKEIPYSIEGFKLFFNKTSVNANDFFTFAETAIKEMEGLVAKETLKCFTCEMSKLKKFKSSLTFSEFDINFIRKYEQYMRLTLQNRSNTVAKTFKKLKRLFNIAIEKNLVEKSPFETVKLKYEKSNRVFLTMEEVENLETLFHNPKINVKHKNVLQWFLFSCYTGLRYSDLYNLKWENIDNNRINLIQEKTNEAVYIPLNERALKLLPKTEIKTGKIFKVYSNQKCNDYLKVICTMLDMKKELTFHCSRHTFATVSLNLGIRFEVVSKLLGHSDLKTTKIYARLLNETTDAEMLKWNRV